MNLDHAERGFGTVCRSGGLFTAPALGRPAQLDCGLIVLSRGVKGEHYERRYFRRACELTITN